MKSNAVRWEPETIGAHGGSGELGYWPIYLSSLLIFYAILSALYLILRFGWFGDDWPTQQDVRVEILWAAIGTIVLIGSSVTIALAESEVRANRSGSARRWLMVTVFLGIGFLYFQGHEYRSRWKHNLIPSPFSGRLHDRADLYFLSAVNKRLSQLAATINTSKVRQNQLGEQLRDLPHERRSEESQLRAQLQILQADESKRVERLAIVNRLLNSEAKWTSGVVALAVDTKIQRMAMTALAHDIFPLNAFNAAQQEFYQLETQQLEERIATARNELLAVELSVTPNSEALKPLLSSVAELSSGQKRLIEQLTAHHRQLLANEELVDAPEQAADPHRTSLESQIAAVQQRLDDATAKLTAAATRVTQAEDRASQLSQELASIAARQATMAEIQAAGRGLNQQFEWLRLPVCIPGGTIWAWTYYVLTGLHTIQLLMAVICVLVISPRKLDRRALPILQSTSRRWHSLVIVWSFLFMLIYLI